jgi:hypothetical protein
MNTGFVYIAGPYRAKDGAHDWTAYTEIDKNIADAKAMAARLASDGIPFFCPHLNSAHFEVITPDVPPDFWLALDLRLLEHASALMLIKDWRESSGARTEKAFAHEHEIPVYTDNLYDQFLDDWFWKIG